MVFLDPGLEEEDLTLDSMNQRQPVTGGNTGMFAGMGNAGFGNNLMAKQRWEMANAARERQRLMGGGGGLLGGRTGYETPFSQR